MKGKGRSLTAIDLQGMKAWQSLEKEHSPALPMFLLAPGPAGAGPSTGSGIGPGAVSGNSPGGGGAGVIGPGAVSGNGDWPAARPKLIQSSTMADSILKVQIWDKIRVKIWISCCVVNTCTDVIWVHTFCWSSNRKEDGGGGAVILMYACNARRFIRNEFGLGFACAR